ncbi:NRDE protein-domain-containing protein [Aspergillus ambiguus]|uniref:NRDE family protein n=1 Tax=Aspergillus ambiguus TaxID=176160 RepID=UPI003CCD50D5
MCIAILSTAHPDYRLIVCNNRDEFFHRPTSRAAWWPSPHSHVLGARDLARAVHGTWLGITRQGRLAILTNYHEDSREKAIGNCSRGEIVNRWLTLPPDSPQTTDGFTAEYTRNGDTQPIGGFNLVCGNVLEERPLAVLSNRGAAAAGKHVHWVAGRPGETVAVSNTSFGDQSWDKVGLGERGVAEAIAAHARAPGEDEDALVERLMGVLSADTLTRLGKDVELEAYLEHLPRSVFVPPVGRPDDDEVGVGASNGAVTGESPLPGAPSAACFRGLYGTQKQTVVLVGYDGRVRFVERTLYDEQGRLVPEESRDLSFEFVCER